MADLTFYSAIGIHEYDSYCLLSIILLSSMTHLSIIVLLIISLLVVRFSSLLENCTDLCMLTNLSFVIIIFLEFGSYY